MPGGICPDIFKLFKEKREKILKKFIVARSQKTKLQDLISHVKVWDLI